MPIFERTTDELVGEVIGDILNNTAITSASPGTKIRAIVEACMKRVNRAYRTFDAEILTGFIRHAEGDFLDWIGEILSLPRLGSRRASASAAQGVVKFFVEGGAITNFGDLNSGSDIPLPAGTRISSSPIGETTIGTAEQELVGAVVLNRNLTEQYVSVTGIANGTSSNVGRFQLKFHDFNGITDPEKLKVINTAAIDNGAEEESDASYRYRLSKQVTAAEAANETAIRLAALGVPGVADIVTLPYHRGIGTFDLLIKATTPTVSLTLISAVESAIASVAAVGSSISVRAPDLKALRFEIDLFARRTLKRAEEDDITASVRDNLKLYVNSLDIGEEFIVNEAIQRVMETSDEIKNMGTAARPFRFIYIGRERTDSDEFVFARMEQNGRFVDYRPDPDERIIIDTTSTTPITIRWPGSPGGDNN